MDERDEILLGNMVMYIKKIENLVWHFLAAVKIKAFDITIGREQNFVFFYTKTKIMTSTGLDSFF